MTTMDESLHVLMVVDKTKLYMLIGTCSPIVVS